MMSFVEKRTLHVFKSTMKDIDIPEDISLPDFLFQKFNKLKNLDLPALTDGSTGESFTINELMTSTRAVASGLARRGIKKADVVAIVLPNTPHYFQIFQGAALIGAINTTINPTYKAESIAHQFRDSGVKVIVTLPPLQEKCLAAVTQSGLDLKGVVMYVIGGEAKEEEEEGLTILPFSALTSDDGSLAPKKAPVDPKRDVVALPYSSGTTGLPKGVMLTHYNIIANLCQITEPEEMMHMKQGDGMLAILPFFHIYGMVVVLMMAVMQGAHVVSMPRFDAVNFLTLIQKHKITFLPLVPPLVLFLAKHPVVAKFDISSVKEILCGAAPLGPEVTEMALKRLPGVNIRQGYGMTEMSPASHISLGSVQVAGSCGVQVPNMEAMLIDPDTGNSVGVGGRGELWLRGPNVMRGYLNNALATAQTIDSQGWIHTGDIATVDTNGNFFIVDRLKELIKVKGFQVAPAELEAILQGHAAVADAAVIPVPDEKAGELPKAFVVLKDKATVKVEDIQSFVAEKVEKYKRIAYVEFVETIPKSASGKILRRVLKEQEKKKKESTEACK